jgi:hypothetical protein
MSEQIEIWMAVIGYDGYYEVSNTGKVKACEKSYTIINRYGASCEVFCKEKILKPSITNPGYERVTLCVDNKRKTYSVHRLVMIAFKPNPLNLPQINHKDGNKRNNNVDNLEWCNQEHNQQHAYVTGLNVPKKSWDDNQSKAIIVHLPNGDKASYGSIGEASKQLNIKRELISKCTRESRPLHHGRGKGLKFSFL